VVDRPTLARYRGPLSTIDSISAERLRRRKALIAAVLGAVSPGRLVALCARHAGPEVDPRRPGVPDLFAFRRRTNGGPMAIRFVEVKRPRERLAAHQAREIAFMRRLKIRAGVVRLTETNGRLAGETPSQGS